jgi:hypothetical protein
MSNNGYIKLNRKFFENVYWLQKRTFSLSEAWLDLIQMARFDAGPTFKILPNGRQITIERGEVHASLRFLSSRWGWSVEKTLRYVNNHIEKQEIERRTEQGESVIKLCNYDNYNPLSNTDPNTRSNTHPNTGRTPTRTNNNKEKKEKKRNNLRISPNGENAMSNSPKETLTPSGAIDYKALIEFFNRETKGVFGNVRYPITGKREGAIRARIREHGKEAFAHMIQLASKSDFLKGENQHGFTATFDWLIKPNNFQKVIEGNYENRRRAPGAANTGATDKPSAKAPRDYSQRF